MLLILLLAFVGTVGLAQTVVGIAGAASGDAIMMAIATVGALMTGISGFAAFTWWNTARNQRCLHADGLATGAEITEIAERQAGKNRTIQTGRYRFRDQNGTRRTGQFALDVSMIAPHDRAAAGDMVEIVFLPYRPGKNAATTTLLADAGQPRRRQGTAPDAT